VYFRIIKLDLIVHFSALEGWEENKNIRKSANGFRECFICK